jgi:hypothetical protein
VTHGFWAIKLKLGADVAEDPQFRDALGTGRRRMAAE